MPNHQTEAGTGSPGATGSMASDRGNRAAGVIVSRDGSMIFRWVALMFKVSLTSHDVPDLSRIGGRPVSRLPGGAAIKPGWGH